MITDFQIKNFKSHLNTKIELSNINVFTGMNGMGKSSAIQSLLLLRQSYLRGVLSKGLELNGDLCSVGLVKDAVHQFGDDNIGLSIEDEGKCFEWLFKADPSNLSDTFARQFSEKTYSLDDVPLFNNRFQYISAYRNGPVNDYEKDTSSVELLNQISRKEGRCELVAHFFDHYKDYVVEKDLLKNAELENSVKAQVEEWMREISPNININVKPNDASFKISYDFSRGKGLRKLEEIRATNTGFGVSYVLPIVLASIVANAKSPNEGADQPPNNYLIIIENPEAHIHPRAQASLMELICLAASKGVQFIIETHSDHIINSILVAINNGFLTPEDSKMYYFSRDEELHATDLHKLVVTAEGRIKNPPTGFFDQIDIHMKKLMGF